jgi:hypothetical protein
MSDDTISVGKSTSTKSPGHNNVDSLGARTIWALSIVCVVFVGRKSISIYTIGA